MTQISEVRELLNQCKDMMVSQETQSAIQAGLDALKRYEDQVMQFRQYNLAQRESQIQQRENAGAVMAEARSVRDGVYAFIDNVNAQANRAVTVVNVLLISVSLAALAMGMLVAFMITRGIVKPVNRIIAELTAGSEQVAAAFESGFIGVAVVGRRCHRTSGRSGETSSVWRKLSSMTKQNADNAQQANCLAGEGSQGRDTGAESMRRMNGAIQEIQKSSDETAKIIKVIDDIAFQTNLLALNAAVEAARAGEPARGLPWSPKRCATWRCVRPKLRRIRRT